MIHTLYLIRAVPLVPRRYIFFWQHHLPFSSLPAMEDETQNKNQNQQLLTVAQMEQIFQ